MILARPVRRGDGARLFDPSDDRLLDLRLGEAVGLKFVFQRPRPVFQWADRGGHVRGIGLVQPRCLFGRLADRRLLRKQRGLRGSQLIDCDRAGLVRRAQLFPLRVELGRQPDRCGLQRQRQIRAGIRQGLRAAGRALRCLVELGHLGLERIECADVIRVRGVVAPGVRHQAVELGLELRALARHLGGAGDVRIHEGLHRIDADLPAVGARLRKRLFGGRLPAQQMIELGLLALAVVAPPLPARVHRIEVVRQRGGLRPDVAQLGLGLGYRSAQRPGSRVADARVQFVELGRDALDAPDHHVLGLLRRRVSPVAPQQPRRRPERQRGGHQPDRAAERTHCAARERGSRQRRALRGSGRSGGGRERVLSRDQRRLHRGQSLHAGGRGHDGARLGELRGGKGLGGRCSCDGGLLVAHKSQSVRYLGLRGGHGRGDQAPGQDAGQRHRARAHGVEVGRQAFERAIGQRHRFVDHRADAGLVDRAEESCPGVA